MRSMGRVGPDDLKESKETEPAQIGPKLAGVGKSPPLSCPSESVNKRRAGKET